MKHKKDIQILIEALTDLEAYNNYSFLKTAEEMSLYEENNVNQSIFLHIGPHLVFENVKQMNNTTKFSVTCCKSSPDKKVNKCILNCDFDNEWNFM